MVKIYKLINGVETELHCSSQEDAETMVKSNPEKYSLEKRVKEEEISKNDSEFFEEIDILKSENSELKNEIEEVVPDQDEE